jgi:hypothetical protein
MHSLGASFLFWLARFLHRRGLKLCRYHVAPRDLAPEIKEQMRRSLAERIKSEIPPPEKPTKV